MISPKCGLERSTSNLTTASVLACSACGLNGLPTPTKATLSCGSTAGVDQIPPPAYRSSGCLGGWIVHVFLISSPVWRLTLLRQCTRAAGARGSSRSPTATEELTLPPCGTCAFHTSLPVSALAAKTQPRVEATYMQPSAMTGVPVKSPAPPLATD